MSTATITGPLIDSSGHVLANRAVTISLVSVPGHTPTGEVVMPDTLRTDADGDFSVELTCNSDIDPSGTFWKITCGRVSWTIQLTVGGTWHVGDPQIQVVTPSIPSSTPLAAGNLWIDQDGNVWAEVPYSNDNYAIDVDDDGYVAVTFA